MSGSADLANGFADKTSQPAIAGADSMKSKPQKMMTGFDWIAVAVLVLTCLLLRHYLKGQVPFAMDGVRQVWQAWSQLPFPAPVFALWPVLPPLVLGGLLTGSLLLKRLTPRALLLTAGAVPLFAGLSLCMVSYTADALSDEGLTVTYYRGVNFEHQVCRRHETKLSADYDGKRPAFHVPAEGFSARWEGWLIVPADATYDFDVRSHDGIRFKLDRQVVVERWHDQDWGYRKPVSFPLTKGPHSVEVEHYSRTGRACFWVRWSGPEIGKLRVIDESCLRRQLDAVPQTKRP